MVMNKTSSRNSQFNGSNSYSDNNNGPSRPVITNGKNASNILYYGHDGPRIEEYKASF